jgi:hypothetical protein
MMGRRNKTLHLEDGDVGSRVASGENRVNAVATRQRDVKIFVARDGVIRRDHDARPPVNTAGWVVRAGVHGDDVGLDVINPSGEVA